MNNFHFTAGLIGGLTGGLLFGVVFSIIGVLPLIASTVNSSSAFVGWVMHLIVSMVIGVIFAFVFGRRINSYGEATSFGLFYGVILWILGALVLLPLIGLNVSFSGLLSTLSLVSLVGYLVYGLVLGLVFGAVDRPHLVEHDRATRQGV